MFIDIFQYLCTHIIEKNREKTLIISVNENISASIQKLVQVLPQMKALQEFAN